MDGGKLRSATIPTLFCIDPRWAKHAAACIVSLIENNPGYFFDIVVVSTGDLRTEAGKLRGSLAAYPNCALKTIRLDTRVCVKLAVRAHYSIDTYTRLWVSDFFPASATKVLYLDSDMIVTGDIGALWRTELDDALLAAVTIPGSTRCAAFGIPEAYGYFNAGVMVIDLARWRREQVFERLLDWLGANGEKVVDAEQDILNACLYDRRLPLPPIYNVISPFFLEHQPLGIGKAEIAAVRADARIIHFNGASKPWSYLCRHPRRADYWHYLGHTEWRDDEPEDRNFANWTKKTLGPLLPAAVRNYMRARVAAPAE